MGFFIHRQPQELIRLFPLLPGKSKKHPVLGPFCEDSYMLYFLLVFSIRKVTGQHDRCEKAVSFTLYIQTEFISLCITCD